MPQIETPPRAGFFSSADVNRIPDRMGQRPPMQAAAGRTAASPWSTAARFAPPREIIAPMRTDQERPKRLSVPLHCALTAGALLGLALFTATLPARAQSCESRPNQAQMVQANFQRVAKEGDLVSAQDYAERTQRGLEQLAAQARRCGCDAAQRRFEEAAGEMRRAKASDSRKAMSEVATHAAATFDSGMAEQRKCAGP